MGKIHFSKLLIFALIITVSFTYAPQAQAGGVTSFISNTFNSIANTINVAVNTGLGVLEKLVGSLPGLNAIYEDGECRLQNTGNSIARTYIGECGGGGSSSSSGGGAYCGDGSCNGGETCSSCSADCGQCGGGGGGGSGGSGSGGSGSGGSNSGGSGSGGSNSSPIAPPFCDSTTNYGGWSDCNAACHNYGSQSRDVSGTNSDCSTFSYPDSQSCYVSCPPVCDFSTNPSIIVLPQTSTLSWVCQYAEYGCSIDNKIGSVNSSSGSVNVVPSKTTTYALNCNGIDGSRSWQATVTNAFEPIIREVIPR